LAGIIVVLLAEVSIGLFDSAFRFSLGPVGLAFFALLFMTPAYLIGAAAGLTLPLIHGAIALAMAPNMSIGQLVVTIQPYVPETLAYTVLGFLLFAFRVSERTRNPQQLVALIAVSDLLTTCVELALRAELPSLQGVVTMALVAVGRAAVGAGAFYLVQAGVRERQWVEERQSYRERLLFASTLQTETFFLSQSVGELDEVMAKAHQLNRELTGHPGQPLALAVAGEIHAVRKDYQRTLSALYWLVEQPALRPQATLAEVVDLVFDSSRTYAETLNKSITLSAHLSADFRTPRYGRWVSILHNLVSNAMEACAEEGSVTVLTTRQEDRLVMWVADTGSGIPEEEWDLIFSPGFSTKVRPATDDVPIGTGLTHVAGLVQGMGGTVRVEDSGPNGTTFRLDVPWDRLEAVQRGG
jgi:two-component system, sensor histidine kinase YcbA